MSDAMILSLASEPIVTSRVSPETDQTPEASDTTEEAAPAIVQTAANTEICVEVGDTVEYEHPDGRLDSAKIVRGTGDPTNGSINRDSALAKALLDAETGDAIEFLSPKGKINLVVRAIHRPAPVPELV